MAESDRLYFIYASCSLNKEEEATLRELLAEDSAAGNDYFERLLLTKPRIAEANMVQMAGLRDKDDPMRPLRDPRIQA